MMIVLQVTACNAKDSAKSVAKNAKEKSEEVADKAKDVADAAKDKAKDVKDKADDVKDSIIDWYENLDLSKFEEGWEYATNYVGANYSAVVSSEYIQSVSNEISNLKTSINTAVGSARGTAQEAGFAAEKWAAGTFNIDSAARGSDYKAEVVGSNELGSVDVSTNFDVEASLKYYQSARGSAGAQAKSFLDSYKEYCSKAQSNANENIMSIEEYLDKNGYDPKTQDELLASIYEGQTRIIPTDQIQEATDYLNNKINKYMHFHSTY